MVLRQGRCHKGLDEAKAKPPVAQPQEAKIRTYAYSVETGLAAAT